MTRVARQDTSTITPHTGTVLLADEPLPTSVRRVAVGLLDGVLSDLDPRAGSTIDEGIHSARKKMKRLRALLRLVRDSVGQPIYREHNIALRDAARFLAPARDAWVQVETLRTLKLGYADLLDEATFGAAERWLSNRHARLTRELTERSLASVAGSLATRRSRLAEYRFEHRVSDGFESIRPGIERVYRRGHDGCRLAIATASAANFHEWRKRVKYLRYQLEYLVALQQTLIGSMAEELDRLGEQLGQEHDLDVLGRTLDAHPEACPDERERWLLFALIYERRVALQHAAKGLGTALYAEDVDSFVDRIGAYWRTARS